MQNKIYEMVTEQIIKKLEAGIIPWRKPWDFSNAPASTHCAVSWVTGKPYTGINNLLLPPGEYATFKQIQAAGGKVRKNAKGLPVIFWKQVEVNDEEEGKKLVPMLRYYVVFDIITQVEGLRPKYAERKAEVNNIGRIEKCEEIVKHMPQRPAIIAKHGDRAYYNPAYDIVVVPTMEQYKTKEEYYSTLFHELVHATGHESRLARPSLTKMAGFGSQEYSKEELIAEIGSAMLCSVAGIEQKTLDNSAAYIAAWLKALKNDKRMVIVAAGQAEKAAKFILNMAE